MEGFVDSCIVGRGAASFLDVLDLLCCDVCIKIRSSLVGMKVKNCPNTYTVCVLMNGEQET